MVVTEEDLLVLVPHVHQVRIHIHSLPGLNNANSFNSVQAHMPRRAVATAAAALLP